MKALALLSSLLLFSVQAGAEERFEAQLVPVPGSGSSGSGSCTLVPDDLAGEIRWELQADGLGSPELAAHVHGPGGEILFPLPTGNPRGGVWSDPGPVNLFLLRQGALFVLVHTEENPAGELRGDLLPAGGGVPSPGASFGELKAARR